MKKKTLIYEDRMVLLEEELFDQEWQLWLWLDVVGEPVSLYFLLPESKVENYLPSDMFFEIEPDNIEKLIEILKKYHDKYFTSKEKEE